MADDDLQLALKISREEAQAKNAKLNNFTGFSPFWQFRCQEVRKELASSGRKILLTICLQQNIEVHEANFHI